MSRVNSKPWLSLRYGTMEPCDHGTIEPNNMIPSRTERDGCRGSGLCRNIGQRSFVVGSTVVRDVKAR